MDHYLIQDINYFLFNTRKIIDLFADYNKS